MSSYNAMTDIQDVSKMTQAQLKKAYKSLSEKYKKVLDGAYCSYCDEFKDKTDFYMDTHNASGVTCMCKACAYKIATQIQTNKDKPNATRETVMLALEKLNKPFINTLYDSSLAEVGNEVTGKTKSNVWSSYIKNVSMPQYKERTWADSLFDENEEMSIKLSKKDKEAAIKRFGDGYSDADLKFLYNEYKDWVQKYECSTKSMELVFQRIVSIELEIRKAQKAGKPTKDLDKTLQDMMDSGGLKPKQNSLDTFSDAQTFGTLIQKYEETRPLPEIDPELADVDKIGLYIDSFYRGHACKMLGLKNSFSHLYEKVMSKYTVNQPKYDEETDSEVLFEKIFGSVEDE